ncbi:hypothetical protein OAU50_05920 [Planctomycetota bacterium]|nr:hypothetical protein [Planctomycetota bacterium]
MRLLISTSFLLVFICFLPCDAQKAKLTVTGIYPSEIFYAALQDFAGQTGYALDTGDFSPEDDLGEPIWVCAKNVTPKKMAELLSASSGFVVKVWTGKHQISVAENAVISGKTQIKTEGFDVSQQIENFKDYLKTYGELGDPDEYSPAPGYELLELIEAVVTVSEDRQGASVGNQLLFSEPPVLLSDIKDFLDALASDTGGESQQALEVRSALKGLREKKIKEPLEGASVKDALWTLLGDLSVPVTVTPYVLEELELSDELVSLEVDENPVLLLQKLSATYGFDVGSKNGALILDDVAENPRPIFRVFNADAQLKQAAEDYKKQKSEDVLEGFHGDFRKMGGMAVLEEAVSMQLDNHECNGVVYSWGSRLIVVGTLHTLNVSVEVMKQLGTKKAETKTE